MDKTYIIGLKIDLVSKVLSSKSWCIFEEIWNEMMMTRISVSWQSTNNRPDNMHRHSQTCHDTCWQMDMTIRRGVGTRYWDDLTIWIVHQIEPMRFKGVPLMPIAVWYENEFQALFRNYIISKSQIDVRCINFHLYGNKPNVHLTFFQTTNRDVIFW